MGGRGAKIRNPPGATHDQHGAAPPANPLLKVRGEGPLGPVIRAADQVPQAQAIPRMTAAKRVQPTKNTASGACTLRRCGPLKKIKVHTCMEPAETP